MRDPAGTLRFDRTTVHRTLSAPTGPSAAFLHSPAARSLVSAGQMVPFEFVDAGHLRSPRLPFVSYPFEWCDAQLRAAGRLTLDIAETVTRSGHELKDASAWNVIFDGGVPQFCDHLSFQPIERAQWWAFGQFLRHFIFPSVLAQQCDLRTSEAFLLYRDGIPADKARSLLGARRYLTRIWPLLARSAPANDTVAAPVDGGPPKKTFHQSLYSYCRPLVAERATPTSTPSAWSGYTASRDHYPDAASRFKAACVDRWLTELTPGWVVDLGCNTGEFSEMALARGAQVIAVDLDPQCIERLFLANPARGRLHALVANLGDLSGGRGWGGTEFPGLASRLHGRADLLLMLALIHHLALSEGIPLPEIAALARSMTRRHLVIELLDSTDPMVVQLARQRDRAADEFSLERQFDAFAPLFAVVEYVAIPATARTLVLLEAKA